MSGPRPRGASALACIGLVLALCAGADAVVQMHLGERTPSVRTQALSASPLASARPEARPSPTPEEPATETLPASRVCADAGYLCTYVAERGSYRILRFSDETERIRVHVHRPAHEEEAAAHRLRDAAVRGIRQWDGRPFPIRFVTEEEVRKGDLVVKWKPTLPGGGLGETESSFEEDGSRPRYRVAGVTLATRNPYRTARRLSSEEVELTATHEMGHALGLPHSDDQGDVMYPTDSGSGISPRDYRTVEAVYALPNGARIVGAR